MAETSPAGRERLVVFSDDWGRHPSSCQHIVRALARRYRIDWVNTIGTRRPSLRVADLRRGAEKLARWLRLSPARPDRPNRSGAPAAVTVHAPLHWPGFGHRIERAVNRRLLLRSLQDVLRALPTPRAIITTLPITADLARATADLNWVYYCVDDLAAWPGLDAATLRRMEANQLPYVRHVIAVSEVLRARMRVLGREAALLPHGVDVAHWQSVRARRRDGAERPVALFWGLADRRLDPTICTALAEQMRLRIIGPRDNVDAALASHPNIDWRDAVPYDALPGEAAQANVLVMPYADLPVTRAMQPLKLLEYLATPLPVVATPLPANLAWADAMDIAASPEEFAAAAKARAAVGLPESQRIARLRIAGESWEAKAAAFERLCLTDAAR